MKKLALTFLFLGLVLPGVFFFMQKTQSESEFMEQQAASRIFEEQVGGDYSSTTGRSGFSQLLPQTDSASRANPDVKGISASTPVCRNLSIIPDPSKLVLDDDLEFRVQCTSSDPDEDDSITQVDFKFVSSTDPTNFFVVSSREIVPDPWTRTYTATLYYPEDFDGKPNFMLGQYKVYSRVCSDNPGESCSEFSDAH